MNIAVLMGGISPERNVSLRSGIAVTKALREKGHNVIAIDPALGVDCILDIDNLEIPNTFPTPEELELMSQKNIIDSINSQHFDNIDCAFIVLHGSCGEDGKVQGLLHLRGIKYTGSGVKASAIAMDKRTSKLLFSLAGVLTPHWVMIDPNDENLMDRIAEIKGNVGKEVVVKPNDGGSTIGLTIIKNGDVDEIYKAIKLAGEYSNEVMVEQFIEGRELTVTIIDNKAYPIIEIKPSEGFYDYSNKYTKGKTEYICRAEIDENETEFIQNMALTAHRVVGCRGYSRIDFRLDDEHLAHCLEVNTVPGFTELSLVPMAARAAGVDFGNLCEHLINRGINYKN